jgi:histidyl-tRNA synthetase
MSLVNNYKINQQLFSRWASTCDSFGIVTYYGPTLEIMHVKKDIDGVSRNRLKTTHNYTAYEQLTNIQLSTKFSIISRLYNPDIQPTTTSDYTQLSCDIVGGNYMASIIELLLVAINFFQSICLSSLELVINISDRRLFQCVLHSLCIDAELHGTIFNVIRKRKSIDELKSIFTDQLGLSQLNAQTIATLTLVRSTKQFVEIVRSSITDKITIDTIISAVRDIDNIISSMCFNGFGAWIEFNPVIVGDPRCPDILFGFVCRKAEIKHIICTGQHTKCFDSKGTVQIDTVGIRVNDVIILDTLKKLNKINTSTIVTTRIDYCIICSSYDMYVTSSRYATILRRKGFNVFCCTNFDDIDACYKFAIKNHHKIAILFHPDTYADHKVIVGVLMKTQQDVFYESNLVDIDEIF